MAVTIRGDADFVTMPWRNGLGQTTELLRQDGPEGFMWRLSRAAVVEDGAFSLFPHVDRILLLLSGAGLVLQFADGAQVRLTERFGEVRFAGDAALHCALVDGPCEDFNIMADRRYCAPRLVRHQAGAEVGTGLFYALDGDWTLDGAALPVGHLGVVEGAAALAGAGLVLQVVFEKV